MHLIHYYYINTDSHHSSTHLMAATGVRTHRMIGDSLGRSRPRGGVAELPAPCPDLRAELPAPCPRVGAELPAPCPHLGAHLPASNHHRNKS
jgi:hypothetical protein